VKYLLAWSGLLALWALVSFAFSPEPIVPILLGATAAAVAALALVTAVARAPRRPAPDLSPATVVIAVGVCALLSGTELGTWCLALGALTTAAGVAALLGERGR
jgi:hypothetical protein